MTLSDQIRERMATATPDAREFGEWVLAQLSTCGPWRSRGTTPASALRAAAPAFRHPLLFLASLFLPL